MTKTLHARPVIISDVISVLFARTLKVRYRGSLLGVLWSAINPLAMASVYAAIFGRAFASHYGYSLLTYGVAVYIGLVVAGFFISGTTQALPSIVQNGGLLNKIRIPFEALPLSVVAAYAFQQAVGTLPLIVVASLVFNHNPLHVLAMVIPVAGLTMLSVGAALIVSGADVFFRDVPYLYELAMFLLWLTSPVFYPAAIVPPAVLRLLVLNPLFPIMESMRALVLTNAWPSPRLLASSLVEGAVVLACGVVAFRAMRGHFMELL